MVSTHGLTHINLTVRDPDRSLLFYSHVFGVQEYSRDENAIHCKTPGAHDVLTFTRGDEGAGQSAGVIHFGFRLLAPEDIDAAALDVERAGGTILRRGEFSPGYPYLYIADPDGYEVEIWYE